MLVLAGPRPDHQGWRGWKSRAPLDNLLYIIDTVEPSSWNRFPNQNLGLALSDSWKQHSRTFSAPLLFNRKSLKSLQSGYLYHTWVGCSSDSDLVWGFPPVLVRPEQTSLSLSHPQAGRSVLLAQLSLVSWEKPQKSSPSPGDAITVLFSLLLVECCLLS